MAKFFGTQSFASSGDRSSIPDDDYSGKLSFLRGFGSDYQKDLSKDPNAKNIQRTQFNQLFNIITESIGEMQLRGSAEFLNNVSYPKGAIVYTNGESYINKRANNTQSPVAGGGVSSTGWLPLSVVDELGSKNRAILEQQGLWECGDTGFCIQWGVTTALANRGTRTGCSASFREPFKLLLHVGAITITGKASGAGFNTHLSIDSKSLTGISIGVETNATEKITINQNINWFAFGVLNK